MFASSVTKVARTATESAVRYGGIASQKVSEMASTVTEKVIENCILMYVFTALVTHWPIYYVRNILAVRSE